MSIEFNKHFKKTNRKAHKETSEIVGEWETEYWKFSIHSIEQCIKREITREEVISCLQYGKIDKHPDYDNQQIAKEGGLRVVFDGKDIITVFINDKVVDKWEKGYGDKRARNGAKYKNKCRRTKTDRRKKTRK